MRRSKPRSRTLPIRHSGRLSGRRAIATRSRATLDAPAGVLVIPAIELTVPIFVGTSDLVLNRGVGLIEGTAIPERTATSASRGTATAIFAASRI